MSIKTRKFSQFVVGGDTQQGDIIVGLRNGQNYQFNAPTGGNGGSSIYTIVQAEHGLDSRDWVYIATDGLFKKADSITDVKAEVSGLVLRKDPDDPDDKFILQTEGQVEEGVFTGLLPGRTYFLSNSPDSGQMVLNDNDNNGEVSLPLFNAHTENTGFIRQFRGIINNGQQAVISDVNGDNGEPVVEVITQNNSFSIGQVVYNDSANHYALAIADGSIPDAHKAVGFVAPVPPPTATQFTLQQSGYMAGFIPPVANLTPAKQYWLSTTTAGAIQDTEPTAIGHWKKPMLQATNTTAGWVLEQLPLQITSATNNPNIWSVNQPGHGFKFNGLVVKPQEGLANVGKYEAAIASNLNDSFGVGMITIIDEDNFTVQQAGYFTGFDTIPPVQGGVVNPAYPLDNGVPYYLSETVAGEITSVQPAEPFYSKPMFSADQTNAGIILPMKPSLVNAGGGGSGELVQMLDFFNADSLDLDYTSAWKAIPFLTGTITPHSVGSKIKFTIMMNVVLAYFTFFQITRNGVPIPTGGPAGSDQIAVGRSSNFPGTEYRNMFFQIVDRPNTTAPVTYGISIFGQSQPPSTYHALFNNSQGGTVYGSGYTTWTLEEYA